MKFRMLLITVALMALASFSYGETIVSFFADIDGATPVVFRDCAKTIPMPDGAIFRVYMDYGITGYDPANPDQDILPVVGTATGQVSDNQWIGDGCVSYGVCGIFYSQTALYCNGADLPNLKLYMKAFYPSVEHPTSIQMSESITIQATAGGGWNPGMPQEVYYTNWTCLDVPVQCETTPGIVTLLGDFHTPWPAHEDERRQCVKVAEGASVTISVPVVSANNQPNLIIQQGCELCGDANCEPLMGHILGPWLYSPLVPPVVINGAVCNNQYTVVLTHPQGTPGCCACVILDYIEPVNFSNVAATAGDSKVDLNWTMASETNIDHYTVLRNDVDLKLNIRPNTDKSYSYTDKNLTNGNSYKYVVAAIDVNGARTNSSIVNATLPVLAAEITKYDISQNYPNPFNPSTTISYDVLNKGFVTLKVYNAMGQEVTTLVNTMNEAKTHHTVTFDASNLTSGLYFYTIKIGNEFSATKKMLLVK